MINEFFWDKEEIYVAFLDGQGAFDNVDLDILLAQIGFSRNIVRFVKFLTHQKHVYIEVLGDDLEGLTKAYRKVTSPTLPASSKDFLNTPKFFSMQTMLHYMYVLVTSMTIFGYWRKLFFF